MSELLVELTSVAILGEYETLRQLLKAEQHTTLVPLPFALGVLPVVSGNDLEVNGYRRVSNYERRLAFKLLHTASTAMARRLLQAQPQLADEVLDHKAVKKHLTSGPLKRLSRNDQAVKGLRALLADPRTFMEYQDRDLFEWDNGDVQGAMAIVYAWRQVVTKQRGMLQPVGAIHQGGRMILSTVLGKYPENSFLRLIDHQARLAWDSRARVERAESILKLEELAEQSGTDERAKAVQALALSSLFQAGLRFQEPTRATAALDELQQVLIPQQPEHPNFLIMRAWAEARGGDPAEARRLALAVKDTQDDVLKVRSAQVLETIGETRDASTILDKLTLDYLPRSNPLASPSLRLP